MLFILIAACDNGPTLAQSWQIDRLRVLAVAAEPAEPRPGEVVSFTSLTVSPSVPIAFSTWFLCFISEEVDTGCELDPAITEELAGIDLSTLTPEEQQALYTRLLEAGLIGVEPYLPPTWTVPLDALDGLPAEARAEGLTATVSITAIPDQETIDSGDLELAYKRLPISEAATPNHNPGLTGVHIDGIAVSAGQRVALDRGQTYTVAVDLAADAVEAYTYVDSTGTPQNRVEQPYIAWYLEEGEFDQEYTLYPYLSVLYTTPVNPELVDQSLWIVVRDRRGGMGWLEVPISVI